MQILLNLNQNEARALMQLANNLALSDEDAAKLSITIVNSLQSALGARESAGHPVTNKGEIADI